MIELLNEIRPLTETIEAHETEDGVTLLAIPQLVYNYRYENRIINWLGQQQIPYTDENGKQPYNPHQARVVKFTYQGTPITLHFSSSERWVVDALFLTEPERVKQVKRGLKAHGLDVCQGRVMRKATALPVKRRADLYAMAGISG